MCAACGSAMWQHRSGDRRYYACPGRKKGLCEMAAQVPAEKAGRAVIGFLTSLLAGWPEWVSDVYRRTCDVITEVAARVPADAGGTRSGWPSCDGRSATSLPLWPRRRSPLLGERVAGDAERDAAAIEARLAEAESIDPSAACLPDEQWVRGSGPVGCQPRGAILRRRQRRAGGGPHRR